jgi:hypothetical protein
MGASRCCETNPLKYISESRAQFRCEERSISSVLRVWIGGMQSTHLFPSAQVEFFVEVSDICQNHGWCVKQETTTTTAWKSTAFPTGNICAVRVGFGRVQLVLYKIS